MRKGVRNLGILGAVMLLMVFTAGAQEDMEFVDNAMFDDPQRTSVPFRHDDHNERAELEDCTECHHIYEDGQKLEDESSEDQSCSDCHTLDDEDGQPNLTKAFHLNCKGCHLKLRQGPILCGECHPKE